VGLNLNSVRLLFEARAAGVSFRRTLTLGRQSFACNPVLFGEMAACFGFKPADYSWLTTKSQLYAEDFFKMLDAEEVVALDASPYEGAQLVHDMNKPISPEHEQQYDVVLDGGALEHIFHFPTAVKNCMDMVKCGGHLLLFTPINNYCGHGFYQFSPEMFFRVLSSANGFELVRSVAWEERVNPRFYEVADPAQIKRRVELITRYPVLMLVEAWKRNHVHELTLPQQSDYCVQWETNTSNGAADRKTDGSDLGRLKKRMLAYLFERHPHLSQPLRSLHRWRQVRMISFRQKSGFTPAVPSRQPRSKGADE
jgi:hypothetical protein